MSIDISVIMPTFRRPHTLVAALKSVIEQDGVRVEVLVIDDCPDGSAEKCVARMGDARIRYLRNPQPSGGRPAILRNLGLPLATGELIHFLDDDDIVPPGHYKAVLAAFDRMPHVGVVFGRMQGFGERRAEVRSEQRLFIEAARRASRCLKFGASWAFTSRLLFEPLMFVGGAAVVRRQCVEAVGGWDTSIEVMEDVDFYARTIRKFGAYFMDRVALLYRIHDHSLMHGPNIKAAIDRSYRKIYENFRTSMGVFEFYSLKLAARTILRVM
jgi:glycosyltransferase involved in cell wall biosynthesis